MNSHIPPQATFFYKGKWIQEMDSLLLTTLIQRRNSGRWDGDTVPPFVLREAVKVINSHFGSKLVFGDVTTRLSLLKQRYFTFKDVVAITGARWDFVAHFVEASEEIWHRIFQRIPFAGAYCHRDEPEFNQMATMFGLYDVKVEEEEEEIIDGVITLSDTTEVIVISETVPLNELVPPTENASLDADEVTSPPAGHRARVRRNLFDSEHTNHDNLSSTRSPSRFIHTIPGAYSPKGSSCASWSPLPTSHKTAP